MTDPHRALTDFLGGLARLGRAEPMVVWLEFTSLDGLVAPVEPDLRVIGLAAATVLPFPARDRHESWTLTDSTGTTLTIEAERLPNDVLRVSIVPAQANVAVVLRGAPDDGTLEQLADGTTTESGHVDLGPVSSWPTLGAGGLCGLQVTIPRAPTPKA